MMPTGPVHLIVLIHGLWGGPRDWKQISAVLLSRLTPSECMVYASSSNVGIKTYRGIDRCGEMLAQEIQAVVARTPTLTKLSMIGHSMGGLITRYAIGVLYTPKTGLMAGLQPTHFISMATPHLGCGTEGVSQIPFLRPFMNSPLLPASMKAAITKHAPAMARAWIGQTGLHFFLADAKHTKQQCCINGQVEELHDLLLTCQRTEPTEPTNRTNSLPSMQHAAGISHRPFSHPGPATEGLPLLAQLTSDLPDRCLFFLSGLASFKTRTCYANSGSDHLVGHANASLRCSHTLPTLDVTLPNGVVLEQPAEAGVWPAAGGLMHHDPDDLGACARGKGHPAALLSAVCSTAALGSSSEGNNEHKHLHATAIGAAAAAAAAAAAEPPRANWAQIAQAAQTARATYHLPRASASDAPAVEGQQGGKPLIHIHATSFHGPGSSTGTAAAPATPATSAALTAPVDAHTAAAQLPPLHAALPLTEVQICPNCCVEPEQGCIFGFDEHAAAADSSSTSRPIGFGAAVTARGPVANDVELLRLHMLNRLNCLPWRRIDVSFHRLCLGTAHGNIQYNGWINFAGRPVTEHLAKTFLEMDSLIP